MRWSAILALALGACSEVGPFYCEDNFACIVDDEAGVCTEYGLCAFFDPTCPGPEQLRYDESAGELAEVCVGDEEDF